jgi:hypothetical protein
MLLLKRANIVKHVIVRSKSYKQLQQLVAQHKQLAQQRKFNVCVNFTHVNNNNYAAKLTLIKQRTVLAL